MCAYVLPGIGGAGPLASPMFTPQLVVLRIFHSDHFPFRGQVT